MHLVTLLVGEAATPCPGGEFNILGAGISRIAAPSVPAMLPLAVASRLHMEPHEVGSHTLHLEIVAPSGKPIFPPLSSRVDIPKFQRHIHNMILINGAPFTEPGVHTLVLTLDGRRAASWPLEIVVVPPGANVPAGPPQGVPQLDTSDLFHEPAGPLRLTTLIACQAANAQAGGTYNLLGAGFDRIVATQLPMPVNFAVLLRVDVHPPAAGEHEVEMRLIDADGRDIIPRLRRSVTLEPSARYIHELLQVRHLPFPTEGLFTLEVFLDGRPSGEWNFQVERARHGKDGPEPE
jgi:hypothetical protein